MRQRLVRDGRWRGRVVAALAIAVGVLAVGLPAQPAAAIPGFPGLDQYGAVAWGFNTSGQLGDRTLTNRLAAVNVYGMSSSVTQVAAGSAHSLALRSDGTVWAWGSNSFGQLGEGTTTPWAAPQRVYGLTGVTQIAASGSHSMALKSDGTVWAWGYNYEGMLGDGTTTNRSLPVLVVGLSGVTQIAAGGMHSLALRSDGSVWSWGAGDRGQLGDGSWYGRKLAGPASLVGGSAVQISAGFRHNLALLNDGTVRAWGDNSAGQLGNGAAQPASSQGVNVGLTNVTQVSAGFRHSLAACPTAGTYPCSTGAIFAWGDNSGGQLGDGTTVTRTWPVRTNYNSQGALQLAGGLYHSVARVRTYAGTVVVITWGLNHVGQLGDLTTTQRLSPVQAYGLTGATKIAAGDYHNLAIKWIDGVICCASAP